MPASVCGHLVVDVLSETAIDPKKKNRALEFLNSRLAAGGVIFCNDEAGVVMMKKLVSLLNSWLQAAGNNDVSHFIVVFVSLNPKLIRSYPQSR